MSAPKKQSAFCGKRRCDLQVSALNASWLARDLQVSSLTKSWSPSTCGSESWGGSQLSEILGFDRDILLVATAKQNILGNPRTACVFLFFCNYIFQNENILNLGSTSPSPGRFKEKRLQGKAGEMPRKPFPTRQLKKYAALNQDQTRREGSFFLGHPLKGASRSSNPGPNSVLRTVVNIKMLIYRQSCINFQQVN